MKHQVLCTPAFVTALVFSAVASRTCDQQFVRRDDDFPAVANTTDSFHVAVAAPF